MKKILMILAVFVMLFLGGTRAYGQEDPVITLPPVIESGSTNIVIQDINFTQSSEETAILNNASGCRITSVGFLGQENTLKGKVINRQVRDGTGDFAEVSVKLIGSACTGKNIEVWIEPFGYNAFQKTPMKMIADKTSGNPRLAKTSRTIEEGETDSRFYYRPGFHSQCNKYGDPKLSLDKTGAALKDFGGQSMFDVWKQVKDSDYLVEVTDVLFCGFTAAAKFSDEIDVHHSSTHWNVTSRSNAKDLANTNPSDFVAYTCFTSLQTGNPIGVSTAIVESFLGNNVPGVSANARCNNQWKFIAGGNGQVTDDRISACAGRNNCQPLLAKIPGLGDADGTINTQDINLGQFVNVVVKNVIGLGSIFAVLVLVYAGFTYLTPSASSKSKGKTMITNVFSGILVLATMYIMLNTINPDLLVVDPQIRRVAMQGTIDNFNVADVMLGSSTVRNSGRGYEMKGSFETPTPSSNSWNLEEIRKELKEGAHITKLTADVTQNKHLHVYLSTGSRGRMPLNYGAGGAAQTNQAKIGDKKTPLGNYVIGGDIGGGQKAAIKITKTEDEAIISGAGANMGAAFLGINIVKDGAYRGIGIHGRGDNTLASTFGCIRVHNDDLLMIAEFVKQGTPLQID